MDPPPVDLLSSFPEHLQDEILARLDLRDAVRTSALSRAWRRRWETIPGLALSFPDGTPASAVDRVLLRYAGPSVSRFVSYFDGNEKDGNASASHVDDWIMVLSRRSVESISILSGRGGGCFTAYSIYLCDRLVSLRLEGCAIPFIPQRFAGFVGFPVLKELYLKFVDFEGEYESNLEGEWESQLETMIRNSPMLRVLFLDEVEPHTSCVIEAPNLHTLGLISWFELYWEFGDLPCLQYASINVSVCTLSCGPGDYLAGVSQVQELTLNLPLCHYKMMDPILRFTFCNLKSMELLTDFCDMEKIILMFCLLRNSPNLEKLKIELQQSKTVANWKFLKAQWTDGMCANLKVVQIISYEGWLPLYFIKLILSKASLLHTLSVDACLVSQDDRLNELLNCRRASPQAQILFKVQLERIRFGRMKFAEKDSTTEQA